MSITLKTDNLEILKGKFSATIAKIEGYHQEAKGDKEVNQGYQASAVFGRMDKIKDAFYEDLRKLALEIEVKE